MSYALDVQGVVARTAAELIAGMRWSRVVYLAADSYDLTAETSVEIRSSLISFGSSTILLPTDDLITPVFRTSLKFFDGMTFEGVNFGNPAALPITIPSATKATVYVRRCCFSNLVLSGANGFLPVDSNVDAVVSDCTMTTGVVSTADLCLIRRCQIMQSSGSFFFDPTKSIWLIISGNVSDDQTLYMSGMSMHTVDTSPPTLSAQGLTIEAPFIPPEDANRADIIDWNDLANVSNPNTFGTQESVYMMNNTFTSPVAPTGADSLLDVNDVGGVGTAVFSDSFGLVSAAAGASALLDATVPSSITLGTNQFVAAERGGANITAGYTLGTV